MSNVGKRQAYILEEVLAIRHMLAEGKSLKEISGLTGRPVNGLRYKFTEGELTKKDGSKYIRSFKRFSTNQEIFNHFNAAWVGDADVVSRVEAYINSLSAGAAAV